MKAGVAALGLALAGCIVLGGCSRGATAVQIGDRDQVLHRGLSVEPVGLDPILATDTSYYTVLSALLEGLVAEDPVDLHPVPGVASSWEVSPDGLTYTFHLRADARWSDGAPVTSSEFLISWERMLAMNQASVAASQLYIIRGAEAFNRGDLDSSKLGLNAPDPRTLSVTLLHPAPWFLSVLSGPAWMPVPLASHAEYQPVPAGRNPWSQPGTWIGNGPFNLKEWKRGQEIIVARSPTYWDVAHVRLREIHFHPFDSLDSEERSFRSGQLHVTEAIPPSRIEAYRGASSGRLRIDPLLGTYFMRINVRRPGLGDRRVRLALALAIDRDTLAERVLRGGQEPAYSFTPPGIAGYSPDPAQRRSIDSARRLLAEAGHAAGSGLPTFTLLYNTSESHRDVAEAVQEMWRLNLGIRIELVNQELKSTEEARRAGDYDLLLSSWIADYVDPSAFLEMWRGDSGDNFTGWSSADYDALVSRADATAEPSARNALYGQAERLLLNEAPIAPLYHYTHAFLIQPSVHGWNPTLLDLHPYKAVWLGQ
jgi:oligopeptide transport system substrate-binding protein